jgi:hypothetical protein
MARAISIIGSDGSIASTGSACCFINYYDVNLPASWPTLYYKDRYPALQAVKARWDPRNVFNHARSICPPRTIRSG